MLGILIQLFLGATLVERGLAGQIFTLSSLPTPVEGNANFPRRLFAGPAHYSIESVTPRSSFGESVVSGDFDGNGHREFAVGMSRFAIQGKRVGQVAVFSLPRPGVVPELISLGIGNPISERFGSVLAAGDVDGDGRDDLLVGIHTVSVVQRHVGMGRLFPGSGIGISWSPSWDNLGTPSSAPLPQFLMGDVNRDGLTDVIIASPVVDSATGRGGGVWLYSGYKSGLRRIDSWFAPPPRTNSLFGASLLLADVTQDSWLDLLIGAPGQDGGAVYLYPGGPGGLATQPASVLKGPIAKAGFGTSLAVIENWAGTGRPAIAVGAPGQESMESWPGAVYLHLCTSNGLV